MTIGPKSIIRRGNLGRWLRDHLTLTLSWKERGLHERAQSSAEFVAIFPMLLILLFLMIEFGWLVKNYLVVTNAGREAARCAAVNSCQNSAGVTVQAKALAKNRISSGSGVHGGDLSAVQFSIHYVELNGTAGQNRGDRLVVCIESPSRSVTPLLIFAGWSGVLPNPVPLKARTEMRVEAVNGYTGADLEADPGNGSCTPDP